MITSTAYGSHCQSGKQADRQDLSLLISQYLHTKPNSTLARTYDEEVLGIGRGKQRLEDIEEVERAITGVCYRTNPRRRPDVQTANMG
jgi:hypothetical protein